MITIKPGFSFFGLCLFIFIFQSQVALAAYTLVYSGNLNGELEPCGCTLEGDFGGIKRQVSMIDQLRQKNPGLMFVSSGGLLIAEMPSDRIRSDYILRGMKLLNYDVIGVQARDLAFGTEFLTHHQLPFILSNSAASSVFDYKKTLRRQSQAFSFLQWSALPAQAMLKEVKTESSAAIKQLRQKLIHEKKSGAITVVTTTLRLSEAKKILPLKYIDLLIIPSRRDTFTEPVQIDNTLLLQPGARGMRFGVLQFGIKKHGLEARIVDWRHKVIPLPQTLPDSPRTEAWYAAYNAELKADYEKQVRLRTQLEQGKSPYAGAEKCRNCHLPEYQKWKHTQHALAYEDLESVGKNFDPNCIGCHSVGFNRSGGFLNTELTPHLSNVQCESCHGPAQAHVERGGKTPTGNQQWDKKKICAQCHIGNHSPSFKLETYWPKVAHGKKTKAVEP